MARNDLIGRTGFIERRHPRLLARPGVVAFTYLIALTAAEALTTLIAPRAGMILHGLILIALLLQASLTSRRREYRFLIALSLAPLIRLLSLALPLNNFPLIYWYVVVGIPLFIATFLAMRVTGLKRNMVGLCISWRTLPSQLLIGITGLAIGYVEYLILRPDPLVAELSWETVLFPALILLIFTGFLEELIFRGVMQTTSIQELGQLGIFFVAAVFAVLHLGYRSILDVVFVFTVAVIFSVLVHRTSSLFGVSLSHGLTNISLYLIFPFLLAAPLVPTTGVEEGRPAPADILSPAVITPSFQIQIGPTPSLPLANTPTPTATPSPTETSTQIYTPVTPTLKPTEAPTQTPSPQSKAWPTQVAQPSPTPIIPTSTHTAESPTLTNTPIPPTEAPTLALPTPTVIPTETPPVGLPTETSIPLPPSSTPTEISTLPPSLEPSPTEYPTNTLVPTLSPIPTQVPTTLPPPTSTTEN